MRTSLNDILAVENSLFKNNSPEDRVLFEVKLIIYPDLEENVSAQEQAYKLIHLYGRQQLKAELESVHQKLFNLTEHRSFADKIRKLFTSL